MAKLADHRQLVFLAETMKFQFQGQTAVAANLRRFRGNHILTQRQQRRTRLLLIGVGHTGKHHWGETVSVWVRVFLDRDDIGPIAGEVFLRFGDVLGECLADGVL